MSISPLAREPIYSLPSQLVCAKVLARPSKINKSPYLADIVLNGTGECAMAHTPALGCCGLIAAGAIVWVMPSNSAKAVSKYVIYLVEEADGNIICAHPTVANDVAAGLLEAGLVVPGLRDIRREVCIPGTDCRFDFCGVDSDGVRVIIEVKSAPIADYVDCMPRQRARELAAAERVVGPKMAIFPHGNNRKEGVISPRALHHAETLARLVRPGGDSPQRCVALYISMRSDVDRLTISKMDAIYRAAVMDAAAAGVELCAWSVHWDNKDAYVGQRLTII